MISVLSSLMIIVILLRVLHNHNEVFVLFFSLFYFSGWLVDFVSQEHGYHGKDPKVSNAGGCTREIKRATKHGDGRLDTLESTPHDKERH
jgi:hypothetical protein